MDCIPTQEGQRRYITSKTDSTHAVVAVRRLVTLEERNLGHSADTDDTLDGKVGLVSESAGKVVRRQLGGRNEGILNEVLRPLIEEVVL